MALLPQEPEAQGLLALMLYAQSRQAARRDAQGNYVPLAAQDTRFWDAALIDEAEALLQHASCHGATGRFQLEAAVQSAHAMRRHGRASDWPAIVALYDALHGLTGSPVAALNRAVALAEAEGPQAGLQALELLAGSARLAEYQPYWAARVELSPRCGALAQAREAYQMAIGLEREPAVRRFLQQRSAALSPA